MEDEVRLEALDLGNQARVLMAADKTAEAKQLLDRALEVDPMCAEIYDHLGAWYMTAREYKKAKEHFKKAVLIDKNRGESYFNLGNACLMLGQMSECLDNYNRALSAGYDQAEMQFYMALAYEENQEYDLALRHLNRAILKDPSVPDFRVKKAHILIQMGRLDEAEETAQEIIQACPELYDGYHLRTILLLRKGDYDGACRAAREAAERFPEDVGLRLDYVRSTALAGDFDGAFRQLEQARGMKYFETERPAFGRLEAELYAQRGELDKAAETVRETLALDGADQDGGLHQLLMNLMLVKEDYPGLLEAANSAAELGDQVPQYRSALYYRALALRRMGREAEAQQAYREAIRTYRAQTLAQPGLLDAYLYRAMAHKDLGEAEKALEMADFLLTLDGQQPEAHILRAEIYQDMGRQVEADAERELACSQKPELRKLFPGN